MQLLFLAPNMSLLSVTPAALTQQQQTVQTQKANNDFISSSLGMCTLTESRRETAMAHDQYVFFGLYMSSTTLHSDLHRNVLITAT